jgi:ribosomal protein S18 acetylase RimI-like enzyme
MSVCSAQAYDDPEAGDVMELAVRRPWRRHGIAMALLHHSFAALWQRGKKSVMLGVDADSLTGATRLYQKVGMRIVHKWYIYQKELLPGLELSTQAAD